MSYKPTICFLPAAMDACALWRMYMPHLNLPGSRFLFSQAMPPFNDIGQCDVAVVQRQMVEHNLRAMDLLRQFGMRIVYDLDDHVWDVPRWNPAYEALRRATNGISACIEWADVITVSTPYLRKMANRHLGPVKNVATGKLVPVVVQENYVDLRYFSYQPELDNGDTVVIGWAGSNTHSGDTAIVALALEKMLLEFDNVFVDFVGDRPPQAIRNHPRVRMRPWVHVSEFAARLATWNWDIILAPLEDHPFNYAKSAIKMIEAGAIGKAALCSHIENYARFCEMSAPCRYSLCATQSQWETRLRTLVAERDARKELGMNLRRNVEKNFSQQTHIGAWDSIVSQAMG